MGELEELRPHSPSRCVVLGLHDETGHVVCGMFVGQEVGLHTEGFRSVLVLCRTVSLLRILMLKNVKT